MLFVKTTKAIADQAWITRLQFQTDGFPIVFILNGERKTGVDQNEAMHETTSWLWRRRSVDWARSAPYRFDRAAFAKYHLPNGRWHHAQLSDSPYPSSFSNVDRPDYLPEINLEFYLWFFSSLILPTFENVRVIINGEDCVELRMETQGRRLSRWFHGWSHLLGKDLISLDWIGQWRREGFRWFAP